MGRGQARLLWALAVALALPAAPAGAEALRLQGEDPAFLRGLPKGPTEIPPLVPRVQYINGELVYRLPKEVPELAKLEPKLTHLCRLGAFIQKSNAFLAAATPTRNYGVAFSGGANLSDPQNLRQPGTVYFFDAQDARCTVYSAAQTALSAYFIGTPGGR